MNWPGRHRKLVGKSAVLAFLGRSLLPMLLLALLASCSGDIREPVIVWTNRQEFASYAELFNASQNLIRVVVVYKESPVESLPPARDEQPPDVVVGSWLRNDATIKQFRPLGSLFSTQRIDRSLFYPQLLAYGSVQNRQYLLPVSFNLPAIIFATRNNHLVTEDYLLTADQVRDLAGKFNRKNKAGIHTNMGFAPNWSPDFLYTLAQLRGANFRGDTGTLAWSQENLEASMEYVRHWTETVNASVQEERDFAFKYLYTPESRQVLSGSCLFAFTSSAQLFSTPQDQLQEISFRWLHQDNRIPVEDDMVFAGIHRNSRNTAGAEAFVAWFMKEESQHQMMERAAIMNLGVTSFGIAGGFSAIQSVTERVFPTYYKTLLANLPAAQYIAAPTVLLPRWESLKARVINPWLSEAAASRDIQSVVSLEQRMDDWSKQYR